MLEEKFPGIMAKFPNTKVVSPAFSKKWPIMYCFTTTEQPVNCKHMQITLTVNFLTQLFTDSHLSIQAFQGRMSRKPAIEKFLQPGSKRKPQPDDAYVKTVMEVFKLKLPIIR